MSLLPLNITLQTGTEIQTFEQHISGVHLALGQRNIRLKKKSGGRGFIHGL